MTMDETAIVGLQGGTSKEQALAERKAMLKRQAEFYRVGIVHSRATIRQGARPEALFHTALDHASWALRARVDSLLRPTGINVAAVMPFAMTIIGFITRRRLVKPALGVLAAAGAVALYVQRRRAKMAY
jgi:hypothetical protein